MFPIDWSDMNPRRVLGPLVTVSALLVSGAAVPAEARTPAAHHQGRSRSAADSRRSAGLPQPGAQARPTHDRRTGWATRASSWSDASGDVVLRGRPSRAPVGTWNDRYHAVYDLDFSRLTEAGSLPHRGQRRRQRALAVLPHRRRQRDLRHAPAQRRQVRPGAARRRKRHPRGAQPEAGPPQRPSRQGLRAAALPARLRHRDRRRPVPGPRIARRLPAAGPMPATTSSSPTAAPTTTSCSS